MSTLSGIDEIASLFRKTVYLANYLPIGFYRLSKLRPLVMPKGLQDSISGKPLTLDEIVTRGLWQANSTDLYFKAGVRIVDCEKNSLKDFAVETLNNYLGYGREKNSSTESKLQEFFAFTSKVPVHLTGKVPEVSKLWMNYEYSNP